MVYLVCHRYPGEIFTVLMIISDFNDSRKGEGEFYILVDGKIIKVFMIASEF